VSLPPELRELASILRQQTLSELVRLEQRFDGVAHSPSYTAEQQRFAKVMSVAVRRTIAGGDPLTVFRVAAALAEQ
jgi:hypothetical protein